MKPRPRGRVGSAAVVALAVCCAVLLAACGRNTIVAAGAERSVADAVSGQTGFRPTDVRCPAGVSAKVGVSFECHFTGPEPRPYTATMVITSVHGTRVVFHVTSRPSAPGAP